MSRRQGLSPAFWLGLLAAAAVASCATDHRAVQSDLRYELDSYWGTSGESAREFREPIGIDVDAEGNVYVADARNGRVQKLTSDGKFVAVIGSPGEGGEGQLQKPVDVAVNDAGAIYVCDYELDRVLKFGADGTFVLAWGGSGSAPGRFEAPAGIAVDEASRVYVADFYNHRIQVFDSEGQLLEVMGSAGAGEGQLQYPTDVAFDGEEKMYVADAYNHRVQQWDVTGGFLKIWGRRGSAAAELDVPSGVAVDGRVTADRSIVHIADSANHRLVARNAVGKVVAIWELTSDASVKKMHSPTRVAVHGNRVYAVDTANDRIVVLVVKGP